MTRWDRNIESNLARRFAGSEVWLVESFAIEQDCADRIAAHDVIP
jgi:hypothetical protein